MTEALKKKDRREIELALFGDSDEALRAKRQLTAAAARAAWEGNHAEYQAVRNMYRRIRL